MPHKPNRLFDSLAIRDTVSQRPILLIPVVVTRGRSLFVVNNELDQAVDFTIVGDQINNPAGAPDIGGTATIAANTRESISTDIWAPWLGIRAVAAAAPTSGGLTVDGFSEV